MRPATRAAQVPPSPTVAVSERARALKAQGIDVIDLGGGDPDFPTPAHVREAAIEAMNAGHTHYVAGPGIPKLRQAIAEKLRAENGIAVEPEGGVVVTPGGKAALFLATLAFVESGVDVLIPEPAWVSYAPMVSLAGGRPVSVPLDADQGFRIDRDALERARTECSRVLFVNSPNNPTGCVLDDGELEAIRSFALEHDLLVFSDEIYEKILYDGRRHKSLGALDGMAARTLTFNGFSKSYAMTGWRLGYVAGPRALLQPVMRVHGHSVTCTAAFVQWAGVAALEGPQAPVAEMVAAYDRRRRRLADALSRIEGVRCPLPDGAFYAFADVRGTGHSSAELAERLLEEAHVAVTPGSAFGRSGEGHLRLAFAASDEALEHAAERITRVLGRR